MNPSLYSNATGAVLRRISVIIRVAGLAQLWFALPWVWSRYRHPALAVALAVLLILVNVVSLWLERRVGRPNIASLLVDASTGVFAMVVCAAAVIPHQYMGWANFAYPYTILLSATFGLLNRLPTAILTGAVWAVAYVAVRALMFGEFVHAEVLAYLIYPPVTWLLVGLLTRTTTETAQATEALADQARLTAVAREQARQNRLLHNNVLQTLEALIRTKTIGEATAQRRLSDDAAWLRDVVSSGQDPISGQVRQGLLLAVSPAYQAGFEVQIVDATLRLSQGQDRLGPQTAQALTNLAADLISVTMATVPPCPLVIRVEAQGDRLGLSMVFGTGLPAAAVTALSALRDRHRLVVADADGLVEARLL